MSQSSPIETFTSRELEILTLLAEGLSNREIGERLYISVGTVKWYNQQIYDKLGVKSRDAAIRVAREQGYLGK